MKLTDVKFDFDDIGITPKTHTNIVSRYEQCIPYYTKDDKLNIITQPYHLPIITAPMNTVVGLENVGAYRKNKILVAYPRTITIYDIRKQELNQISTFGGFTTSEDCFISFGLKEFQELIKLKADSRTFPSRYFLLDVANGHMDKILDLANQFKELYPELFLMVGNIANPETYRWYAENSKVDAIRLGIGNGNGCLTTKQTAIGYPKASLINETFQIKLEMNYDLVERWKDYEKNKFEWVKSPKPNKNPQDLPLIIADGGMKDYSDIIKALALGADYVMIGSIFNKAIESSGNNYLHMIKISPKLAEKLYAKGYPIKKHFYGMSTKIAQQKMGKTVLKTSEGVERYQKVEYTLAGWRENLEHYLRTFMSYSDARTLKDFIGHADYHFITENAFKRFNK